MPSEAPPRFLLLVPPAPVEHSLAAFRTAYDETIAEVLKEVALHSTPAKGAPVLEIAFACPHLIGSSHQPRANFYDKTQELLALLYKLVVVVAARDNINVEDDSGVDVRVLPVAWSPAQEADRQAYTAPVIDLETLAASQRPWQFAFGVESTDGEAMVRAFVTAKSQAQAGGIQSPAQHATHTSFSNSQQLLHVAVGGTFDHMHIGHKLLLTMTLFVNDTRPGEPSAVTIGITGDELLKKKKYAEVLESWEERQVAIQDFTDSLLDFSSWPSTRRIEVDAGAKVKQVNLHYHTGIVVKCTEIQDLYGPTIVEQDISGLVLSAETRSGGQAINKKRSEQGWSTLEVFEVDVLDAQEQGVTQEGFEAKLSSTAIRQRLATRSA